MVDWHGGVKNGKKNVDFKGSEGRGSFVGEITAVVVVVAAAALSLVLVVVKVVNNSSIS